MVAATVTLSLVDCLVSVTVALPDRESAVDFLTEIADREFPDRYRNEVSSVGNLTEGNLDAVLHLRSDSAVLPEDSLSEYEPNTFSATYDREHVIVGFVTDGEEPTATVASILDDTLAATGHDADSVRVRTRFAVPAETDPETVANRAAGTPASHSFELVRESADEPTLLSVDWFDPDPTGTVTETVLAAVDDHRETVVDVLRTDT